MTIESRSSMSAQRTVKTLSAASVCDPCKRRKKACNKSLPSCSRCSRLLVKCSYSDNVELSGGALVLPRLIDVVPGLVPPPVNISPPSDPLECLYRRESFGVENQVSIQVLRLLDSISRKRGDIDVFCDLYFDTFHKPLPIINKDVLYWQLENILSTPHFSTLLLAIFLVTQLSSQPSNVNVNVDELYPTLKSIYYLLQSTGKVSIELVQAGILIASYEHCQALHQDAWISIGSCARMGNILGIHTLIRDSAPKDTGSRSLFETKRCLWWAVVVLERVMNGEYGFNQLPFASDPPKPDDLLPLVSIDDGVRYCIADDLLLPDDVEEIGSELKSSDFTRFGTFAATVQGTYLSSLVTQHVLEDYHDHTSRQTRAAKLDAALQYFAGALIPPPGEAEGSYCGGYGMRTSAAFRLHEHELFEESRAGNAEFVSRAKIALQSLARIIIHATKAANTGRPMDLDGMAFWSQSIVYQAAMVHIRLGERNDEWELELEILKEYLQQFEPRYKLFSNYLRDIDIAKQAAWTAC